MLPSPPTRRIQWELVQASRIRGSPIALTVYSGNGGQKNCSKTGEFRGWVRQLTGVCRWASLEHV